MNFRQLLIIIATSLFLFPASIQAQDFGWCSGLKTSNGDLGITPAGIGADGYGNVYTAGTLINQLTVQSVSDTVTMPPGYAIDMSATGYVIKYNPFGEMIWSYLFRQEPNSSYGNRLEIFDIEVDSVGNFYLCGSYNGEIKANLNGGTDLFPTVYANEEGFVAKYDPDGQLIWQIRGQGPGTWGTIVMQINLTPDGRLICAGNYTGYGFNLPYVTGIEQLFIMSLDSSDGSAYWEEALGDFEEWNSKLKLATDSQGSFLISGKYSGNPDMDFDPDTTVYVNPTNGGGNKFMAKYNMNGDLEWAHAVGAGSPFNSDWSFMFDQQDNLIWHSRLGSDNDVEPGPGVTLASGRPIIKYDMDGNLLEINQDLGVTEVYAMRSDSFGNIHFLGTANSGGDVCPGPAVVSPENSAMYYLKTSPDYTPLSFAQFPNYVECWELSFEGADNPLMVGALLGNSTTYDFDLGSDTTVIETQTGTGFVAKYFVCEQLTITESTSACDSYTSPMNPSVELTESGQYYFNLSSQNYSCDSVLVLDLTVNYTDSVETSLDIDQYTLTAEASNADFQWFDCDNSVELPGLTDDSFTPWVSGLYSVIVEQNGCVDTSACVSFSPIACSSNFSLYPNPLVSHDWFALDSSEGVPPLSYEWSWGDGNASTGVNVSHTYDTAGYYNICLTIVDASGCTDTYCDNSTYIYKAMDMVTVNVVGELPNGVNEHRLSQTLSFYPNPTSGRIQIDFGSVKESITINAYNVLGELIQTETRNAVGIIEYAMPNPGGVYLVQVVYSNGRVTYLKVLKE
jgi:PKD repeat protein